MGERERVHARLSGGGGQHAHTRDREKECTHVGGESQRAREEREREKAHAHVGGREREQTHAEERDRERKSTHTGEEREEESTCTRGGERERMHAWERGRERKCMDSWERGRESARTHTREREKRVHAREGWGERERTRACTREGGQPFGSSFYMFSAPRACPMQIRLGQECCSFSLKSSLPSSPHCGLPTFLDLPLFYFHGLFVSLPFRHRHSGLLFPILPT